MKSIGPLLFISIILLSAGCIGFGKNSIDSSGIQTETTTVIPTTAYKFVVEATPYKTIDPDATPISRSSVYLLPSTGMIIKGNEFSGGLGKLTIDNMAGGSDAIAVVTYRGEKVPLVAVYIEKRTVYTMQYIKDGTYDLFIYRGDDWNRSTGKFETNSYYSKFEDDFPYQTTSKNYTTWSVTLYKVADGNAKEETLSEDKFPQI